MTQLHEKQIRIFVLGALGRMGRAILDAMTNEPSFHLRGAVVRKRPRNGEKGEEIPLMTSPKTTAKPGDVVIDVTRAESVAKHLSWAARSGLPYVLAVTGLKKKEEAAIGKAAKKIPIVVAPNLSLGVAVLTELSWIAGALLPSADIEIVEFHHRGKKDAPSGTALALAKEIAGSTERTKKILLGRPSHGVREEGSIGVHAVRGGDVVGEHHVNIFVDGERLELTHKVSSRAVFARGALRAAGFVARQRPGIYTMRDVLGLGEGNW